MELLVAGAIWVLLLMLLIAAAWSIRARPRPLPLVGSVLTLGVMSWLAWSHFQSRRWCEGIIQARTKYDLDLSGSGDRTQKIDAAPGLRGLQVRAIVLPGGSSIDENLLAGMNLRARDSAGPVRLDIGPLGRLIDLDVGDGFGQGDRTWVELTYTVTDTNREALRAVRLEALAPRFLIKSCFVMRDVHEYLAWGFAAAAVVGLAGALSQGIRLARRPGTADR